MTTSTPGVAFSSRHLHYVGNSGSRHNPCGLLTALKLEDKIHGINIHPKVGLHLTRFKYRREHTRKALRTHLTDRSRTTLGCTLGHICLQSFGVLGHTKDYSAGVLCVLPHLLSAFTEGARLHSLFQNINHLPKSWRKHIKVSFVIPILIQWWVEMHKRQQLFYDTLNDVCVYMDTEKLRVDLKCWLGMHVETSFNAMCDHRLIKVGH